MLDSTFDLDVVTMTFKILAMFLGNSKCKKLLLRRENWLEGGVHHYGVNFVTFDLGSDRMFSTATFNIVIIKFTFT